MTTEEEIVINQHVNSYDMPYLLLSNVLLLVWPTLLRAAVLFLPTMGWGGGEQTGPLSPSFTDPLLQTMVFQIICKSPLLQWPPRFVYPQHFCLRFSIFFIYWQIFPSPLLCNIRPLFLRSSLSSGYCLSVRCPRPAIVPFSFHPFSLNLTNSSRMLNVSNLQ